MGNLKGIMEDDKTYEILREDFFKTLGKIGMDDG